MDTPPITFLLLKSLGVHIEEAMIDNRIEKVARDCWPLMVGSRMMHCCPYLRPTYRQSQRPYDFSCFGFETVALAVEYYFALGLDCRNKECIFKHRREQSVMQAYA